MFCSFSLAVRAPVVALLQPLGGATLERSDFTDNKFVNCWPESLSKFVDFFGVSGERGELNSFRSPPDIRTLSAGFM